MPRSRLLPAASLLFLITALAPAQTPTAPPPEAFRVLGRAEPEAPEITPYLLYLTDLAWQQDRARQAHWSELHSEADLLHLRAELRAKLLKMIGGLPAEKTDLHATVTGTLPAHGFHVEKLVYQSLPGLYVTALVYVPENGAAVHPAILVPAGHSPIGKIHYQDLCQRLALRGYLVIAWDPIGQGERSQFWDARKHDSRYNLVCAEHAVLGNLAYLAGTSLARWEVWDGIRAVDYLLTRPDVDPHRINLTGTSGGGTQAALLGALDDRIHVIIPSCYITALPMRVENRIFADPDSDPEQDPFGLISAGVDHPGLLLMMYPRPVMVATVTLDFFPVQGSHKTFSEVSTLYTRFGHADRIAFAESYNTHSYSLKNQEAALAFLDRFNNLPVTHGLPSVTLFAASDLQVTQSGQLSVDYPNAKPLLSYIDAYAAEASQGTRPTLAKLYAAEGDPQISSWTVAPYTGDVPSRQLRWEAAGTTTSGPIHIDRFVLHHDTYLKTPLLHLHREGAPARDAVLWLGLNSKLTRKDWPEALTLLNAGHDIYSIDLRGSGENAMRFRFTYSDGPPTNQATDPVEAYTNPLASVLAGYVYNSLLTGRPYFLQMLDDMEIATLFIRSRSPHQPLVIHTSPDAALLAASFHTLEPTVTVLPTSAPAPQNWSTWLAANQEQWPIAYLLPSGALIR